MATADIISIDQDHAHMTWQCICKQILGGPLPPKYDGPRGAREVPIEVKAICRHCDRHFIYDGTALVHVPSRAYRTVEA